MNPLFADIGDIIGLIITLAVVGFSVLSQILGSGEKAKQQQQARRREQQQRARQASKQRAKQPGKQRPAKSIESEIEDFLRQARGESPKEAIPVAQVVEEVEEVDTPVRTLVKDRSHKAMPVEPGHDYTRSLSTHVDEHIGHDSISGRDAHLADFIETSDERIEHHLEDVFDHQIGQIAHYDKVKNSSQVEQGTDADAWAEDKELPSVAAELVEMLKSPDSVRKMFIVTEIFKRPDF